MSKIAIVTGGGSGIGAALGQALVRRGAHVTLADIDEAAVHHQAERLTAQGPGAAVAAVVDVRDSEAVTQLVNDTHAGHGRLDLMVNNAGIAVGGEPEELVLAHWNRSIDVNLRGVIHGCHAAYPLMMGQGDGHIVNVASLAGLMPGAGQMAPYAATKFAVVGLSLSLRAAGADRGVRVSVVCPGFIDTPILYKGPPEDLPVPASTAAQPPASESLSGVRLYPPERLAEDVLRGVDRNRALILAPRSARVLALAARFAPGLTNRMMLAATRKFRERALEGSSRP
jgi:NAD(P)-dependent dehydrogenase (short-subunit alcohol dehydrogenase family)